jgi:hypothetical protein
VRSVDEDYESCCYEQEEEEDDLTFSASFLIPILSRQS